MATVAAVDAMIRSRKRVVYAALHVNLSARHNCRSMRGRSNCTLSRLPRQLHVVSRRLCRRRCPHGDLMRMIVRAALLVVLHVAAAGCGDHALQSRCACIPVLGQRGPPLDVRDLPRVFGVVSPSHNACRRIFRSHTHSCTCSACDGWCALFVQVSSYHNQHTHAHINKHTTHKYIFISWVVIVISLFFFFCAIGWLARLHSFSPITASRYGRGLQELPILIFWGAGANHFLMHH